MSNKPTVYLAADSTVQTYDENKAPQAGWGQFIANYFTEDIAFDNRAIGGRSSRTFIEEGRLDEILKDIQAGDYLFVQMGHNDATEYKPERYTEPYTTYKQYLKQYLDGARQHGAVPVLITPVAMLRYENGVFNNSFPDYCNAMKQLAAEEKVMLIDLMEKSLQHFYQIGYEEARTYYLGFTNGTDFCHFNEKGANIIAGLVAQGVKELAVPIANLVK